MNIVLKQIPNKLKIMVIVVYLNIIFRDGLIKDEADISAILINISNKNILNILKGIKMCSISLYIMLMASYIIIRLDKRYYPIDFVLNGGIEKVFYDRQKGIRLMLDTRRFKNEDMREVLNELKKKLKQYNLV